MLLENISFDVTMTIIDNNTQEKAGQFRYVVKDTIAEICDTYLFPDYRRQKIISSIFKRMIPELKICGVSKIMLKCLNEDARIAWESMGFMQVGNGHMEFHI